MALVSETAHDHIPEERCEAGVRFHARAPREGQVPVRDADAPPCLAGAGLPRPDPEDTGRLRPTDPAVAFPLPPRSVDEDIAHRRRQGGLLAETFEPLLALSTSKTDPAAVPGIRMLSGLDRIDIAISEAVAEVSGEVLAIQPHGDIEDRTLALEIRRRALVDYFAIVFDHSRQLATPMYSVAARPPSSEGITHRRRAMARPLIEGHTDAAIADSRAQLGCLIARSGILDQEGWQEEHE